MKSRREELYKLMKDAKIYSLPTSCPCGYVAKKNWIEMEEHYDKCAQFRSLIKKNSIEKVKNEADYFKNIEILKAIYRDLSL